MLALLAIVQHSFHLGVLLLLTVYVANVANNAVTPKSLIAATLDHAIRTGAMYLIRLAHCVKVAKLIQATLATVM